MSTPIGLREKIANAETEAEVISLLASGHEFTYASPRTKLSWRHTAQRRVRQLQKSVETTNTTKQSEVSSKKKASNKKTSNKK
jgi:hypothetical protein